MSTVKCAFKDCHNSKRRNPNLHWFRFPMGNEARARAWIEATECQDKLCDLTPQRLHARGVCALHFEQSSFMNCLCNSLTRTAVPIAGFINRDLLLLVDPKKTREEVTSILLLRDPKIREQRSVTAKQKFVSCEPAVSECSGSSDLPVNNECDPLDTVDDMFGDGADRKEVESAVGTKTDLVDALSKYLSGPALTLFKMQVLRSGNNSPGGEWAVEEKELALTMYYKSASLYQYMRDRQRFVLPSDTDIQHWIKCTARGT